MSNNTAVESLNSKIILFAALGLGLSVYAFIVENRKEHNHSYEPMCDIHEHISCSKAFESEYGKGFGLLPIDSLLYVPNSVYGILHYSIVIGLALVNSRTATKILLLQVMLSNICSVYFAYILYFILANLCIVCVLTYVVNATLLTYTYYKFKVVCSTEDYKTD